MKFWSKTLSISGVTRLGSKIMFYNMTEKYVKEQQNSLQTVYFLGKMSYLCNEVLSGQQESCARAVLKKPYLNDKDT